MTSALTKLLKKELQSSAKAAEWLAKSIVKCEKISFAKSLAEADFD